MRNRIGREPTSGELYIAHFLGARQGAKLIELAESQPNGRADIHFSRAARRQITWQISETAGYPRVGA